MNNLSKTTSAIRNRLGETIGLCLKDLEYWEKVRFSPDSTADQQEKARTRIKDSEARLQEATRTLALVECACNLSSIAGAMVDDGVRTYPVEGA